MQPLATMTRRKTRPGLFLLLLTCGLAFSAGSLVGPAGAETNKPGTYQRLPIMFKDWTDIGDLPDGVQRIQAEQSRQGEYFRRWQAVHRIVGEQHTSRISQALLAKRGFGPALFEGQADQAGKAFDGIDTLKVLIVRISFEENRSPDLTTVEPNGDFLLTPLANTDTLYVDPPPHNRDFYQSHLLGLSEYYKFQSGGRLHIEGTVLPEEQDGSYKLNDIADYGPGTEGWWTMDGLERLVRHMINSGDTGTASTDFDFSDYDDDSPFTYIIFVHAGSDWQSDVNGDSPNDIPTFFVTLGEPESLISGGQLSECSVIPETTNQDGYPGSIAAAFYHEFGHALGLVDIYNTTTGYPSVGIWDLMDSGTNLPVALGHITAENDTIIQAATGVLPPSLSVWNKWFLGWVEIDEVDGRGSDYKLPAVQVPRDLYPLWDAGYGDFKLSYPQAIRAGVSPREYFLLENRFVPPVPDTTGTFTPYESLVFERDEATGVIQYLAGLRGNQWTNSGMYDYFMPDAGLLIWHVNMDRISANLHDNTINAFGDGLRLVEADGIQDIGVLDAYVLGWYGSSTDPFGRPGGGKNLYSDGTPSSRNFDRSWSGVTVTDIRPNSHRSSSVMRFGAAIEPLVAGFPWQVASVGADEAAAAGGTAGPRQLDVSSLTTIMVGSSPVLVFSDDSGENWVGDTFPASLFAVRADGVTPWIPPVGKPNGAVLELDAPLAGPPVLQDGESLPPSLVFGTQAGSLGRIDFSSGADPVSPWNVSVGDSMVYAPIAGYDPQGTPLILCSVAADTIVYCHPATGSIEETIVLDSALLCQPRGFSSVANGQVDQVLTVSLQGFATGPFQEASAGSSPWERIPQGALHTAAIFTTDGPEVYAFDDRGYLRPDQIPDGWIDEFAGLNAPLVCEPAVADLDADGRDDLILATAQRIFAFHDDGVPLRGFPSRLYDLFPLPDSTRITGPLIIADATGDGVNEVFYNTTDGHLMGLNSIGELLASLPFRWGDEGTGGLAMAVDATGDNLLWMVSPGSYATEPYGRNHVNGRIAAYGLGAAASETERTSRWLGAMGGPTRSGSMGLARDLGDLSPLAEEKHRVIMYPNPVHESDVNIRFYAHAVGDARFILYNLQGEEVKRSEFKTIAGSINENRMDVSGLASGLYLGRLVYPGANGTETKTMTLAVER